MTTIYAKRISIVLLSATLVCAAMSPAWAGVTLREICRVKGQEENVLHGLGLVLGLNGTGDGGGYLPTMRALARTMEAMGNPLTQPDIRGRGGLSELKETKNVALVWVTAVVPPTGARRGDKLNCSVSAFAARSLRGGRLVFAALQGPNVKIPRVYALAEGLVHLDDAETPTEGKIHDGCRIEEDFFHEFSKDGKITLVLDKHHAGFSYAAEVVETINSQLQALVGGRQSQAESDFDLNQGLARAINGANIEVMIPDQYRDAPVQFIGELLSTSLNQLTTESRVTIHERSGTIVIDGDVEIGSVLITHKNLRIETGQNVTAGPFELLEPGEEPGTRPTARLQALLAALNA